MSSSLPLILTLFIFGYFALVLFVATRFSRKIENLKDFFLAGRSLPALPIALSFVASWFGASSTIGSINAFHHHGLSAYWLIGIPTLVTCLLITFCFSRRVSDHGTLSQPEAVQHHYGRFGRFLLAIIILASISTFIGSQLVAAGKLCQSVMTIDLTFATILVTSVVVLYAMIGGYFTVVVTDILQFILFTLALLILAGLATSFILSHPDTMQTLLAHRPPTFWTLTHDLWHNVFLVLTFVLAWVIAPEMWQRMTSAQNRDLAFRSAAIATCCLVSLFVLVGFIGMASAGMLSAKGITPESLIVVKMAEMLPNDALAAFVLLGILTAITSTMDSSVNVGSLTVTRDLYHGFLRPEASERELLWVSRIATVLIVIPGVCLALAYQDIIQVLWISADIYASTMFFPVVGLLFIKNPGRWSGILAMIAGGVTVIFSALVQHHVISLGFAWPDWPYSTLIGVLMSGIGFTIGYRISQKQGDAQTARLPETLPLPQTH